MEILILGFFGLIYFIPALMANSRKHKNFLAVFMLNLLLGWTFIGWVLALVWACTDNTDKRSRGFR